jgi:hypothetical protein
MSVAKQDEREVSKANMKLLEKISSGVRKKVALATAMVGGFLALAGAGTASAHPRVVVAVGIGGPVVVRGYVGPGPVYVRPRYEYAYSHRPRVRYWDARIHCWRKNQIAASKIGRGLRLGRLHFVNGGKT